MTTANVILAWLQENLNRLFLKSPTFYKVWMAISAILFAVANLPAFLTTFNLHLPELFNAKVQVAVTWATAGAFLMSSMSAKSHAVAVDQQGQLVKQTNIDKLPFTASREEKTFTKMLLNSEPVQLVNLDKTAEKYPKDTPLQSK